MEKLKENSGINMFIVFVLTLAILRNFIGLFTNAINLSTGQPAYVNGELTIIHYEGLSLAVGIANLFCVAILIVSMIMILLKKKVAVYTFFITQFANAACMMYIKGDIVLHLGIAIASCILLSLLLLLKKDGVSAWRSIMTQ